MADTEGRSVTICGDASSGGGSIDVMLHNDRRDASGTVTLSADHKTGAVDADMLPDTPQPNPALKPIHVKGTFTCP